MKVGFSLREAWLVCVGIVSLWNCCAKSHSTCLQLFGEVIVSSLLWLWLILVDMAHFSWMVWFTKQIPVEDSVSWAVVIVPTGWLGCYAKSESVVAWLYLVKTTPIFLFLCVDM